MDKFFFFTTGLIALALINEARKKTTLFFLRFLRANLKCYIPTSMNVTPSRKILMVLVHAANAARSFHP